MNVCLLILKIISLFISITMLFVNIRLMYEKDIIPIKNILWTSIPMTVFIILQSI